MIDIDLNAVAAMAAIRRAMQLLDNMTPIYADIGEYMVGSTRARFRTGTDSSPFARGAPQFKRVAVTKFVGHPMAIMGKSGFVDPHQTTQNRFENCTKHQNKAQHRAKRND